MGYTLVAIASALVALLSGLLGLGGAVLMIPTLLYVLPILGIGTLCVQEITGATSVQVLASALVGVAVHGLRGAVDRRLVITMGTTISISAFTGALLSGVLSGDYLLALFALLATVSTLMLFLPRLHPATREARLRADPLAARTGSGAAFSAGRVGSTADGSRRPHGFPMARAVLIAIAIGLWGGALGAPGGFVLVPALIQLLGLPTRVAVGSSLGIILVSAIATVAGKAIGGHIPYALTAAMVGGAVPGSYLGSRISARVPTPWLRRLLGIVMLGVCVRVWVQVFQ